MADVVEVEQLRCARCKELFVLCTSCFRGQAYCSPTCRVTSALEQHRIVNARHQESDDGRLDHRDRMRAHRKRQYEARAQQPARAIDVAIAGGSVTDSASTKLDSSVECPPRLPVIARRSLYASSYIEFVVDDNAPARPAAKLLQCRMCGVLGTHIVRRRSRVPP